MIRIPRVQEVRPSALGSIACRRCPRCRMGAVYRSIFQMHNYCSTCGLDFDRGEPGYFTGATFVSYILAMMLNAFLTLTEAVLFPDRSVVRLMAEASFLTIPLFPWIWQYSRILWMVFDQSIDPSDRGGSPLDPWAASSVRLQMVGRGKVRVSTDHRSGPRAGSGDRES